jgi:hypothetical protein
MEGAGFMRLKQMCAIMLVPVATTWIGMRSVQAQVPSQSLPSSNATPLEFSGGPAVTPTAQGLDYRRIGGNAALKQLRNPFDGGTGQPQCSPQAPAMRRGAPSPLPSAQSPDNFHFGGKAALRQLRNPYDAGYGQQDPGLFGAPSPQYGGTPQGPGAMPGAAPGAVPGAGPGAGAATAPGAPTPPSAATPGEGAGGAAAPPAADTFGAAAATTGPGFGGTLEAAATPFAMIGDISPLNIRSLASRANATTGNGIPGPPPPPGQRGASPIYSSVRNFKISENQSPRPQDRVFFGFNYYNNLNNTINLRDLSPVTQMKAYIYTFGLEKTFNNGMGSIGIRLPLDNLTANSFGNVISTPTTTALSNLTVFAKYILCQNPRTGSLVSACFAITPETGPGRFAGAPYLFPLNGTYFQSCLGYIYNYNRWYLQGFSGFSFSANPNEVALMYNDIGIGYFLIRNNDRNAFLTALAPTFELHVNSPLNHRNPFNRFDLASSPDSVDLTYGLSFGFKNTAVLTAAFVTPVAIPRPFDSEAILMLNIFFGRTRARMMSITPPPL